MTEHRLPAIAQPQIWAFNRAEDAGLAIPFDAEAQLLSLDHREFRYAIEQIVTGRHDIDELALRAGVISEWLDSDRDASFYCEVDPDGFERWIDMVGMDEADLLAITAAQLVALRRVVRDQRRDELSLDGIRHSF